MKKQIITGVSVALITAMIIGLFSYSCTKLEKIPKTVKQTEINKNNIALNDSSSTAKRKVQTKLILENRTQIRKNKRDSLILSEILTEIKTIRKDQKKVILKTNLLLENDKKAKHEYDRLKLLLVTD